VELFVCLLTDEPPPFFTVHARGDTLLLACPGSSRSCPPRRVDSVEFNPSRTSSSSSSHLTHRRSPLTIGIKFALSAPPPFNCSHTPPRLILALPSWPSCSASLRLSCRTAASRHESLSTPPWAPSPWPATTVASSL
jgi:hypothetical protein